MIDIAGSWHLRQWLHFQLVWLWHWRCLRIKALHHVDSGLKYIEMVAYVCYWKRAETLQRRGEKREKVETSHSESVKLGMGNFEQPAETRCHPRSKFINSCCHYILTGNLKITLDESCLSESQLFRFSFQLFHNYYSFVSFILQSSPVTLDSTDPGCSRCQFLRVTMWM